MWAPILKNCYKWWRYTAPCQDEINVDRCQVFLRPYPVPTSLNQLWRWQIYLRTRRELANLIERELLNLNTASESHQRVFPQFVSLYTIGTYTNCSCISDQERLPILKSIQIYFTELINWFVCRYCCWDRFIHPVILHCGIDI